MSLTFDPEIAAALAPMAESGVAPPAVGDTEGRRDLFDGPVSRYVSGSAVSFLSVDPLDSHDRLRLSTPCPRAPGRVAR
jgi:hypothetical protein